MKLIINKMVFSYPVDKIFICIVVLKTLLSVRSSNDFDSLRNLFKLKQVYISELYVFACQYNDNLPILREEPVTKSYILDGSEEALSILRTTRHRSRYGVILDLSCVFSRPFLIQSSEYNLFNTSFTWIILQGQVDDLNSFSELNISFDTDMTVITRDGRLVDVYKPHYDGQLLTQVLGHLGTDTLAKKKDRNGFGSRLNIALMTTNRWLKDEQVEILADPLYRPRDHQGYRTGVPFALAFRDALNFTYNIIRTDEFGTRSESGNWTGFTGLYQRGEIDLSFHQLKIRKDRLDVADISFPLQTGSTVYFFLQPPMFGSAKALIVPLSREVWAILGFITLLFNIAFVVISRYEKSPDVENWSAVMIHTLGTIAQQGFNDTTKLVSIRVSSFSLLMFSFLLYLYYGAAVLNGLLSPSVNSIKTEKQLLDSGMKIGILNRTYMTEFNSDESLLGPHTRQTMRMLETAKKQDRMYYGLTEGVEMVKRGHFAFVSDTMALVPLLGKQLSDVQLCSAFLINKISPFSLGLNLRRQSPYRVVWMNKMVWMREVGLVKRTLNYWKPSKPPCVWHQEALSIGLEATSVALAVVFLGLVVAILSLLVEIFLSKKQTRRCNQDFWS